MCTNFPRGRHYCNIRKLLTSPADEGALPRDSIEGGMTLIELVVVITLVGIIGSFVVFRMDSLLAWRAESEIRRFTNTIQIVKNDSIQRQERYRVLIDLEAQTYTVRREVPLDPDDTLQVDYLENLRTQGEQERRAEEELGDLQSLDEEFAALDARHGGALEQRYYRSTFADPQADVRLGVPIYFPSLGEMMRFDSSVRIRDVEIGEQRIEDGTVVLRFLARSPAPAALIHFEVDELVYTVAIHPQRSSLEILGGDISIDDAFEDLEYDDDALNAG